MAITWLTAFLDTPRSLDDASITFWRQITRTHLSERRGPDAEFATLVPEEGDAFLRAQRIGSGPAGYHLDVHVDDVRAHLGTALAAGATTVKDEGTLVVLRSLGGLEFCLVAQSGEHLRPTPVGWPDGHQTLVDQICIDIPSDFFDDEVSFWTELTGWKRRSGALAEFEYLERPAGMPLRLLFQRLLPRPPVADEPPQSVGVHLDLASDDHEAEVSAHLLLGATLVRRALHWVTLRDPAGREYCITKRDPVTGRLP